MINSYHLRHYVIKPTLEIIGWSLAAENLLMGTAAQESQLGFYLKQINGPALGIFQIEPATHKDVWANYINYRPELKNKLAQIVTIKSPEWLETHLVTNLAYSAAIARIIYMRAPEKLPDANEIEGMARYWKKYYNTDLGKGTVEEFKNNYKKLVEIG